MTMKEFIDLFTGEEIRKKRKINKTALVEVSEETECGWRTFQYVFRHEPVTQRFTRRANHQLDWWLLQSLYLFFI